MLVYSLGNCSTQWFLGPFQTLPHSAWPLLFSDPSHNLSFFHAFRTSTTWMFALPVSATSSRCNPSPWTAAVTLLCADLEEALSTSSQ